MSTRPSAVPTTEETLRTAFARDVREGLEATPKSLPPRWFYDALGSSLFEAICRLPWYWVARAEAALLTRHAAGLAARAAGVRTAIELGSGSGEKLALVLDGLEVAGVHLVDVSGRALELSARALDRFTGLDVSLHQSTYVEGLRQAARGTDGPRMVLFLGSNLGNFDPPEAAAFLGEIGAELAPGDFLLLGVDLVKPIDALLLAYDDPLGVTAAFNKNLLHRMNAELGGTFALDRFRHEARWDPPAQRVEMHLVSLERQQIDVPGAGVRAAFEAGESIRTERSYKYDRRDLATLGELAGFGVLERWIDDEAGFAVVLFSRR